MNFVPVKSKKHLENLLKSKFSDLALIAEDANKYYRIRVKYKKDGAGNIKYKNGEPQKRTITASQEPLKQIQKSLNNKIFNLFPFPIYVKGGVRKRCNVQNAKLHQGKKYHFCTDLKSFFPSVSNRMVYDCLIELGFSSDVARLITKLTTLNRALPQGAPTSTVLANLVFLKIDQMLVNYCERREITYTRFVDDLTFSAFHDFKDSTNEIIDIITFGGFKVSRDKTFYKRGSIETTGVLIKNNGLKVTSKFKEKMFSGRLNDKQLVGCLLYKERVVSFKLE